MAAANKGDAAAVDALIAAAPESARTRMRELRALIRSAAPEAEECVSYGMPAFRQGAVLVYFAGWAGHVGFYPTASGMEAFAEELAAWPHSKGAVRFPLDQALPADLIKRVVRYRLAEVSAKAAAKGAKTSGKAASGKTPRG